MSLLIPWLPTVSDVFLAVLAHKILEVQFVNPQIVLYFLVRKIAKILERVCKVWFRSTFLGNFMIFCSPGAAGLFF